MRWIAPNPENASRDDVRIAEKAAASKRAYRRLMAIRLLLEGRDRRDVQDIVDCDPSTLYRWVLRFNRYGIDGLSHDQERPGRPTKIPFDQQEAIKELVRNPYQVGEDFWTARKLHGYLTDNWQIELGYSTLCENLHKLGFRLKVPQPWPGERQDEQLREQFRGQLAELMDDPDCHVWFGDETGIEGDPRPRRRWAERGIKTRTPYTGDHVRENVIGAVQPGLGELFVHAVPYVDSEWFQLFLNGLAEATRNRANQGKRIVLVLDNAGWHKVKSLNWHHIEPMYLPPYSPDLNPIERLWLVLKARWFTNHICHNHQQLADRVDKALRSFISAPHDVQSICG
jgi:transposase